MGLRRRTEWREPRSLQALTPEIGVSSSAILGWGREPCAPGRLTPGWTCPGPFCRPAFPDCSVLGVSEKRLAAPYGAFALADQCWLWRAIDPVLCFSETTSLSLINPRQAGLKRLPSVLRAQRWARLMWGQGQHPWAQGTHHRPGAMRGLSLLCSAR